MSIFPFGGIVIIDPFWGCVCVILFVNKVTLGSFKVIKILEMF